jgi:hypothetical protein
MDALGRHSNRVFLVAASCWIAAVAVVVAWILAFVIRDPSSHEADDAILAFILWTPMLIVALLGVGVVARVLRGPRRVGALALGWSVLALVLGLVLSIQLMTVGWLLLTGGGVQITSGTDWIATYPQAEATYYVYAQDLLPAWFAIAGAVACSAAIWSWRSNRPEPS